MHKRQPSTAAVAITVLSGLIGCSSAADAASSLTDALSYAPEGTTVAFFTDVAAVEERLGLQDVEATDAEAVADYVPSLADDARWAT